MPTRYWIASTVALVLLTGGAAFCWQTRRAVLATMREAVTGAEESPSNAQSLAAAEESLKSGATMADFGMEIPPPLLWRIQLAEVLRTFWPAWIAFVFGICFGIAWLMRGQPPVQSP